MTYTDPETLNIAQLIAAIIGMDNTTRLGVDGMKMQRHYEDVLRQKVEQAATEGEQE